MSSAASGNAFPSIGCACSRFNQDYYCCVWTVQYHAKEVKIGFEVHGNMSLGPLQSPNGSRVIDGNSNLAFLPSSTDYKVLVPERHIAGTLSYPRANFVAGRNYFFEFGSNGYSRVQVPSPGVYDTAPEQAHVSAQVSTEWVKENLGKVKLLDCTWFPNPDVQKESKKRFLENRIPGASFFDVEDIIDKETKIPYMLPSAGEFEKRMAELGVSSNDVIVVYEHSGNYLCSARVWWTFRVFGHDQVFVLAGGLNEWRSKQYPVVSGPLEPVSKKGKFVAHYRPELVLSYDKVKENSVSNNSFFQLVDGRPEGRFVGRDPEPPGIRRGNIEGSLNVPFMSVLRPTSLSTPERPIFHLMQKEDLLALFQQKNIPLSRPLGTSCGSGLTGPVVVLAFYEVGLKNVPHFDGSWTEWAIRNP